MGAWEQVLVFTAPSTGANRLDEYLDKNSAAACAIHGNKKPERTHQNPGRLQGQNQAAAFCRNRYRRSRPGYRSKNYLT